MRIFIFIGALLVLDFYVFQAFRSLSQSWSAPLRNAVYAAFWLVPLIALSTVIAASLTDTAQWNKTFYTFLRTFLFIAYLSKLLILPVLVIDDLRRVGLYLYDQWGGPGRFDYGRSRFLSQLGILLGGLPFVSLTYGVIRNPYRYKVFREKVSLPHLPAALRGLKIIQISDIHSGSFIFREPVKRAIELINGEKPDLVFFTGDMVNYRADEMDPFLDIFSEIKASYGVFSVLGNHDYGDYVRWRHPGEKETNLNKLKQNHHQLGWDLLCNQHRMLEVRGEKVAVIGVENYSAHPRFPKYGDLATAYRGCEEARLKLCLSHDPSHWKDQILPQFSDIDLTFSGHTHGFQFGIEIPGWFKWSPIKYVYQQWAGLYRENNQYLYVNRGLGYLGYPGRVGILPEITVLELQQS